MGVIGWILFPVTAAVVICKGALALKRHFWGGL